MTSNLASADYSSLVALLRDRATQHPDKRIYTFLLNGEPESAVDITYGELDRQARAIGALLQQYNARGERALLLYPQGLDFIAAFFGSLYGGAIAIPAYPPDPARLNRTMPRIQAIIKDARPLAVLTISPILSRVDELLSQFPDLAALRWVATDALDNELASQWQDPASEKSTVAFLQYTSGSTATPKGVMVTHGNLLYNLAFMKERFSTSENDVALTWLPSFHDMGLIDGLLGPVYVNCPNIFMSPISFLQHPFRWLNAISHYRATHTGAPNFAFDLCSRKVTPEQRATLDLSCLRTAYNGAEPLRKDTLERFSEAFKSCGFRHVAHYPCYGLAEGTLMVSGAVAEQGPVYFTIQEEAFKNHRVVEAREGEEGSRTLVGSGRVCMETKIEIVNPETFKRCAADEVGEIWVSGPTIAPGYWEREDVTKELLHAYLPETGEGPFLRTGDLGFFRDEELFVAGRIKDVIIIHGRNYYPQDIELSVEKCHSSIRPGCCAAFGLDVDGTEQLGVVVEVERRVKQDATQPSSRKNEVAVEAFNSQPEPNADNKEIIEAIRQVVAEKHEMPIYSISLIKAGAIFKTTSGKIMRSACRQALLKGTLDALDSWTMESAEAQPKVPARLTAPVVAEKTTSSATPAAPVAEKPPSGPVAKDAIAIESWLVTWLAKNKKMEVETIDTSKPFAYYGLDSVSGTMLAQELEEWIGQAMPQTLIWDLPTIDAIIQHLTSRSETVVTPAAAQTGSAEVGDLLMEIEGLSDEEAAKLLAKKKL